MTPPKDLKEAVDFVKPHLWTFFTAFLCVLIVWQGLTLYRSVRSWDRLEKKARHLLMGGGFSGKKGDAFRPDPTRRVVEATFFYRPKLTYSVIAIFDDRAVVIASKGANPSEQVERKEIKVGDRIGAATVRQIEINSVVVREDGKDSDFRLELHKGL